MRRVSLSILLMVPAVVAAQWDAKSVSSVGMSGVMDTSMWIEGGNPASGALRQQSMIVVGYVPGLYALKELRRYGIAGSVAWRDWGAGIHLLTYGGSLFSRNIGLLAISRSLTAQTSVGMMTGVSQWLSKGYPPVYEWSFGPGFLFLDGPIRVGARMWVSDALRSNRSYELVAGFGVRATPRFDLSAEFVQESGRSLVSRYQLTVQPIRPILLRIGWQDDPRIAGMGWSLFYGQMEMSYGVNWHTVLGWTHGLGIGFLL